MKNKPSAFQLKLAVMFLFIVMNFYLIFLKRHPTMDLEVFPNSHPTPNIMENTTIGQSFICRCDGLSKIEIMMGTHDRANTQDVFLKIYRLSPEKELIREARLNASGVLNNLFNIFEFRPVSDSKNKNFYYELSSPTSNSTDAVCAWMNHEDIYPMGEFFTNGMSSSGDLVFRTYCMRPVVTEFGRIVRNYPGILGSKLFLIVIVILFEMVQILVLWTLLNFFEKHLRTQEGESLDHA